MTLQEKIEIFVAKQSTAKFALAAFGEKNEIKVSDLYAEIYGKLSEQVEEGGNGYFALDFTLIRKQDVRLQKSPYIVVDNDEKEARISFPK